MLIWRKCPRAWGTLGATGGEVGGRGRGGVAGGGVGTRDVPIPKFQPIPIPEILCQPIPIPGLIIKIF